MVKASNVSFGGILLREGLLLIGVVGGQERAGADPFSEAERVAFHKLGGALVVMGIGKVAGAWAR